jgi:hypothetical protein
MKPHPLTTVSLLLGLALASASAHAAPEIESPTQAPAESAAGHRTSGPDDVAGNTSETEADTDGERSYKGFFANYTNILYGPSIRGTSSFQPTPEGRADRSRPVFMKNFLGLSYGFTETIALTASAYWWWQPVMGQTLTMQDPYFRLSDSSIFYTDWGMNLYSDFRVHPGVTDDSRQADQLFGLQSFSYLSWQVGESPLLTALRFSARYNVHGRQGFGTDAEFYFAPEANIRLNDHFLVTLLYEMGASHQFGDSPTYFTNDGTDFSPGIEWDPTPNLTINPYLTVLTGGKVDLASTSVGMFFNWTFL